LYRSNMGKHRFHSGYVYMEARFTKRTTMKKERKTKQLSDWEKEFDKAFPTGGSAYFNVNPLADEVRAFIRRR
jgi:hypothetical protein